MDYLAWASMVFGVGLAMCLGWQYFKHGSHDVTAAVVAYVMVAVGFLVALGLFRLLL